MKAVAMVAVAVAAMLAGGCAAPSTRIGLVSTWCGKVIEQRIEARRAVTAGPVEATTWERIQQGLAVSADTTLYGAAGYGIYRLIDGGDSGGGSKTVVNQYGDTYTVSAGDNSTIDIHKGPHIENPAPEEVAE